MLRPDKVPEVLVVGVPSVQTSTVGNPSELTKMYCGVYVTVPVPEYVLHDNVSDDDVIAVTAGAA
jgi:hypothetical protein